MARRKPRQPATSKRGNSPYGLGKIARLWVALREAKGRGALPAPDAYPGFTWLAKQSTPELASQPAEIKRLRCALYDDQLGFGLQLRWNLALIALREKAIDSGPLACKDLRSNLVNLLNIADEFHQLGSISGGSKEIEEQMKRAWDFHNRSISKGWLSELCIRLNAIYGEEYRKVNVHHRMTIDLFTAPYFSDDAAEDFDNFLRTGEPSRRSRVNRKLISETKRYYSNDERDETQTTIIARLMRENECRPIQCVVSKGAPTAVEAFAVHLGQMLPTALEQPQSGVRVPRRDVFLIPCGRWIKPSAFRGVEYLVHNMLRMLDGDEPSEEVPDMSEAQLQSARERLRELLGQRPVIFIFVGHDAVSESLKHLQEAIIDEPLTELLAHLSRPMLGTRAQPYDRRHFEWTYFIVVGTSDLATLQEFKQTSLQLPPMEIKEYLNVLKEAGFHHSEEIYNAMRFLPEPANEAEICVFEQIRHIEQSPHELGKQVASSRFGEFIQHRSLHKLTDRLFDRLSAPGWELDRALVLLTAFAIGGIKRATLLRCLVLWNALVPNERLDLTLNTASEWMQILDNWLVAFATLLRAGPDESWGEIDPQVHPFEYPGTIAFNLTTDAKEWWAESIAFLIMEVRTAVVVTVEERAPVLAEQIHRILAEEALRQHTMVLRHTAPGDRLTMRSHRRGLQALYHGLESLPRAFDRPSAGATSIKDANVTTVLPAKNLERFRYLYCGLLPQLLVSESIQRISAAWGAERVKLEVLIYADDMLFGRHASEPERQEIFFGQTAQSMFEHHYDNLAITAVRAGPDGNWREIRRRLSYFCNRSTNSDTRECSIALRDKALLQMNLIEYGPERDETAMALDQLAVRLGVRMTEFDHEQWLGNESQQTEFPTIAKTNRFVARHVENLRKLPPHTRSDAATLYFYEGMMRADSAESRISGVSRSAESLLHTVNYMLKSYVALAVARETMWGGYGADDFPLPYLAAEGMRSLCRVGLEIVRILQKEEHQTYFEGETEVDVMAREITSAVRNCLDEYTRVFHTDACERAQMLILESRFARLAYGNWNSWARGGNTQSVLVEPKTSETLNTLRYMRYELAFSFLSEAEACIAGSIASDAVRLRFLSERCSALRYLSEALAREGKTGDERKSDLERAHTLCRLALLDVKQLGNLIDRLKQSNSVWLTHGGKARWGSLVDYHRFKLQALSDELAVAR